jgi:hypothetical protein
MSRNKFFDRTAFLICAILLAILPLHAFLFTWFKSFFWTDSWTILVQMWKEILVGLLAILAVGRFAIERKLPQKKSFWLGGIFVALAILYFFLGGISTQKILGLRTATLFFVAFLAAQFFDFGAVRIRQLVRIILFSSSVVIAFGLTQKFLLPADFLVHFGYSANLSSWLPGGNLPAAHFVGDSGAVRIQSTFAGPNQLAAFLILILPLAFFELQRTKNWTKYFLAAEVIGGILLLIWTFSRSAWLGAVGIFLLFAIEMWRRNLPKKMKQKLLLGGILAIVGAGILFFSGGNFGEIISRVDSTSEHFEKSLAAAQLVVANPLGLGLGETAGVAQRFAENPITPENTFLGFTLELGWLGGILFLIFCGELLVELQKNNSPLFYSLVGILVVAFFLHPLEDAPTALTLFLLAGITIRSKSPDR